MISCSLAARGVTCLSVADFGKLIRSVVLSKEGILAALLPNTSGSMPMWTADSSMSCEHLKAVQQAGPSPAGRLTATA